VRESGEVVLGVVGLREGEGGGGRRLLGKGDERGMAGWLLCVGVMRGA
jgi:hypothetical protein